MATDSVIRFWIAESIVVIVKHNSAGQNAVRQAVWVRQGQVSLGTVYPLCAAKRMNRPHAFRLVRNSTLKVCIIPTMSEQ